MATRATQTRRSCPDHRGRGLLPRRCLDPPGEYGEDGISYGFKVDVCYIAPSSFAKDGRIKVSDAVWSSMVEDMESDVSRVVTIPVGDFERDHAYRPDYMDTTLALGECNLGWIGIIQGNPDLAFHGITYSPSTGERITWKY